MTEIFDDVQPAPRKGSKTHALVNELARGTLTLALRGDPITVESLRATRPRLAAMYPRVFLGRGHPVINTYLGRGQVGNGLHLWEDESGDRTPSRENAALALKWLAKVGCDLAQVAESLGLDDQAALVEAINALPLHATFGA